jgi:hypothetical protein
MFAPLKTGNSFTSSGEVNGNTSGKTIYLFGTQLEAGSYATSYVPTQNSSVTRNADVISKTGISSLIGQTEGTMFLEVDLTHINETIFNQYLMQLWKDSSNRIIVFRTIYNNLNFYFLKGSTAFFSDTSISSNGRHKIAFAYKSGNSVFYIDGVQIYLDTTTFTPFDSLTSLDLGVRTDSGIVLDEIADYSYKSAMLFKTRLSNAELAQLTTL